MADLKRGTFHLTVKGKTATGLPFTHPGVHRLQSVEFGPNTNNTTLDVGAVKLEVHP